MMKYLQVLFREKRQNLMGIYFQADVVTRGT